MQKLHESSGNYDDSDNDEDNGYYKDKDNNDEHEDNNYDKISKMTATTVGVLPTLKTQKKRKGQSMAHVTEKC